MNRSFPVCLLFLFFLIRVFPTRAQRPVFGVYLTTGTINCTFTHGGGYSTVFLHSWLYPGDKLTLADDISEIVLFDRDTGYVRLRGKGSYSTDMVRKMQHTRVHDTMIIRYLSLLWLQAPQPAPAESRTDARGHTAASQTHRPVIPVTPGSTTTVLAPRANYATSLDSLIFRWRNVYWARKYFLRLRNTDGQLCYDGVIVDTQAVVHFPGRMTPGNTYAWTLDIVGESGRLQFADSGHIVLVNESVIFPQLPPVTPDSIGGIAIILQRIEQYENASCIKQANDFFQRLISELPMDAALDQLYTEFRRRNYF